MVSYFGNQSFHLIMSLIFPVVTNFIVTALLFVFPIFQRTVSNCPAAK